MLRLGKIPVIRPRLRTSTLPASFSKSADRRSNPECFDADKSGTICSYLFNAHSSIDFVEDFGLGLGLGLGLDQDSADTSEVDNPIPVPPRDRKPVLTSKPRHTRKHPLIIPPTTLRTLDQFTASNPSSSVDQIDGGGAKKCDPESVHFEQRIDSELAALDDIEDVSDDVIEDLSQKLQSHHVSCEDLLEFADLKPSSRARGNDSDEVRIMSKVLGQNVGF